MKNTSLKPKQLAILDFIARTIYYKHACPTVREIGAVVGLTSTSSVQNHINRLVDLGYLARQDYKNRALSLTERSLEYVRSQAPEEDLYNKTTEIRYGDSIEIAGHSVVPVPLIGQVQAGIPITAAMNHESDWILPQLLVGQQECFLLRVQGESMKDVGIYEHDLLIVRNQSTARNGDIVVARIDDEATVKRFYKEKDHIRLQPENDAFEPIILTDVVIEGKVVGLIRDRI